MALFVVVLGANVYKGITENMTENYNVRTSILYITEKIRQNDTGGSVDIREVGGNDALVLTQEMEGKQYETWIFVDGGELCEVLVSQGTEVTPGFGQPIMELKELRLDYAGSSLLDVQVVDADGYGHGSMVNIYNDV
jgi:hypothetical protein